MPVSVRDPYIYLYLYKQYDKSTHGIVFAWLRNKMSRSFSVNVKSGAERYLGLTYYT